MLIWALNMLILKRLEEFAAFCSTVTAVKTTVPVADVLEWAYTVQDQSLFPFAVSD